MLAELKSHTLADEVAAILLNYIRKENLVPGDAIPKEEELATSLNVSRHIVREGVSQLKAYGIIESRKRRGIVITRPNAFVGVKKMAQAEIFSEDEWKEFLGLRITMEIGMADMIYEMATEEDIAELRQLAGDDILVRPAEEEIAFHSKLFSIGGNYLGNQFMDALKKSFDYVLRINEELSPEEIKTHCDICDALEFGTKDEFNQVIKIHFQRYTEFIINDKKEKQRKQ